jgi:uroporphyrinogen decarboxylase
LAVDAWKTGRLTDGSPALVPEALQEARQPDGAIEIVWNGQRYAWRSPESLFFDVCWSPLAQARSRADLDAFVWPDPWTEREERFLRERVEALYRGTDKALFAGLPMLNCCCCSALRTS